MRKYNAKTYLEEIKPFKNVLADVMEYSLDEHEMGPNMDNNDIENALSQITYEDLDRTYKQLI